MKTIDEHRGRLAEVISRQNEIDTEHAGERLGDEARSEWDALGEERADLEATIDELEKRSHYLQRQAEKEKAIDRGGLNVGIRKADADIFDLFSIRQESRSEEHMVELLRDNAMQAVDRAIYPFTNGGKEKSQEKIERMIDADPVGEISRRVLETGSPLYRRAFGKAISRKNLTTEERTALSTSNAAGGYAVPFALDPTVIHTSNFSVNPWRAICRNIQITGSNTWEGVSSGGVVAAYGSEAAESSDNSPTFAQPKATVQRASAFVPFSVEIEGDFTGLEGELVRMINEAKDDLEAGEFTTATGTAPHPVGILGAQGLTTAVKVVTATTAVFAVADVYSLENSLPPRYRPFANVVGNRAVYNNIRQFDTAGGAQLFVQNLQLGLANNVPTDGSLAARLLDYPTYECSAMSSTPATSGQQTLLLGDFQHGFAIIDRVGMQVELIQNLVGNANRFPTGQRGLFAWWRNATCLLNNSAFVYLQVK